jgi:hypothetical protein
MSSTMVTDLCCASRPPRDLWLSNRHLGAAFPPDLNGEYSVVLEEVGIPPPALAASAPVQAKLWGRPVLLRLSQAD